MQRTSSLPLPLLLALMALGLTAMGLAAPTAHADERSWSTLDKLRTTLEKRSPLSAEFQQSLIPSGFSPEDADIETGKLAMNLPTCLRWDYLGDFKKSFLLCNQRAHYWNPGETVGQIFDLEAGADAPGLDFFLRTSSQLKQRYSAQSRVDSGIVTIDLVPLEPSDDVVTLRITVGQSSNLMATLSYDDAEGNRTTFKLDGYQDGAAESLFSPPPEVTVWEEQ